MSAAFPPLASEEETLRETIVIGEVLKPQGIRGEVKVRPLLDDIADMRRFRRLFIGGAEYKVLSCRTDAQAAYLALSGVADRNAAELLRGQEVLADRAELPALEEGRYYIVDILGCAVVTEKGVRLGEIADILPAHTDIYVLKEGDKEFMFPAAEGVLLDVDVEKKIVTVSEKRIGEVLVEQ